MKQRTKNRNQTHGTATSENPPDSRQNLEKLINATSRVEEKGSQKSIKLKIQRTETAFITDMGSSVTIMPPTDKIMKKKIRKTQWLSSYEKEVDGTCRQNRSSRRKKTSKEHSTVLITKGKATKLLLGTDSFKNFV